MCGIAGAFAFGPGSGPINSTIISQLNDLQHRRGPDGSGLWSSDDKRVVLGHRRLAIIDTGSTGAQPMSDSTGRWTITFNGEIYNYRALKLELERLGCRFSTKSDTEVLINAIAQWGEAALLKLRGMYSFALWDALEQELWLVRDPYGIKPLYVSQCDGTMWFASQARPIASCTPVDTRRDAAALAGFYLWGHVPEPFSWWTGVRMFPAGHVQRIRAGQTPPSPRAFTCVEEAYVSRPPQPLASGELRELLLESVRYHLVSDVPVGIFLSAGIDSNVIASLAAECGTQLHTVTLAFDEYAGTPDDEAPLAEAAAKNLRSNHVTVRIRRGEFEELIDDFFASMDQPSIDGLNTYLISRAAASQGLKVALSGLGGDELFGGYPSFDQVPKLLKWGERLKFLKTFGRTFESVMRAMPLPAISPKTAGLFSYSGDIASAYLLRRALHLEGELDALIDESWLKEGLERLSTIPALTKTINPLVRGGATAYAKIAALESCWYMRNQLLRDTDWSSMAHGLEVRVPYVDVVLLERLGPAIASNKPPTKRDLGSCAVQLPPPVLSRAKTGFTTPVKDWLAQAQTSGTQSRGLQGWAIEVHRQFRDIKIEPGSTTVAPSQSKSAFKKQNRRDYPQTTSPALSESFEEAQRQKRVIIFRQGSIGDFAISLPCLHAIRKNYPSAKITLLTNQPTNQATVPAMNILDGTQLIDDYITYRSGTRDFWELTKIRRALSKLAPETLIYLAQPRGRFAAYRDYCFFRWCGIKRIAGLHASRELLNCRPPVPGGTLWESEASRLARSLRLPHRITVEKSEDWDLHLSAVETEEANRILREGLLSNQYGKIPLLGISIGTKQEINDWGNYNWLAVLNGLKRLNFGLIFIGAAEDGVRSQLLADEWHGPTLNLCGKIMPRVSAAVIKNCALFLCHDSGPMHLAASVGIRCIAVFSRRNPPGQWFPFGKNHKILYPQMATDTIQSIEPNQVIAACMEILGTVGKRSNSEMNAVSASSHRPQEVEGMSR